MEKLAVNFKQIKDKLGSDYDPLMSLYEMEAFNIPYIYDNGRYVAGANEAFAPTRTRIEE
jgi:hypothetical protein